MRDLLTQLIERELATNGVPLSYGTLNVARRIMDAIEDDIIDIISEQVDEKVDAIEDILDGEYVADVIEHLQKAKAKKPLITMMRDLKTWVHTN